MNRKYLLWLLDDWGVAVSKRFEDGGYSSATPVGKMMELGIAASSKDSTTPTSNYWPNSTISDINNAISVLPDDDIQLFVYKHVLTYSYERIGRVLKVGRGTVWRRMMKAENKLISAL